MTSPHHPADQSTFRLRRQTPGSFLLVPCPQQGRSIRCQGQLEAAAAVILVACPQVAHLQEQLLAIWYAWQEMRGAVEIQLLDAPPASPRRRQKSAGVSSMVPDFLVEMADLAAADRPAVVQRIQLFQTYPLPEGERRLVPDGKNRPGLLRPVCLAGKPARLPSTISSPAPGGIGVVQRSSFFPDAPPRPRGGRG